MELSRMTGVTAAVTTVTAGEISVINIDMGQLDIFFYSTSSREVNWRETDAVWAAEAFQ